MQSNWKLILTFPSVLAILVSCHKDVQVNTTKTSIPTAKNYYIKSFALGTSDSITFTYDSKMRLIKKMNYTPNTYGLPDSTTTLFSYDNKDRVDTIKTMSVEGTGYQTCRYNTDGTLVRINGLTSALSTNSYWILVYNNNKQIDTESFISDSVNMNSPNNGHIIFLYDNMSNNIEKGKIVGGKYQVISQYTYDTYNSMYQGLPICNYVQGMPDGLGFGNDFIVPKHNVLSFTYAQSGYNIPEKIIYNYNTAGFPVLENYSGHGSNANYRITYFVK